MRFVFIISLFLFYYPLPSIALAGSPQTEARWAIRIADSFLAMNPDTVFAQPETGRALKWNYDLSVMFEALYQLAHATGEKKYLDYVRRNLDYFLEDNGTIKTYKQSDYSLDFIAPGRQLLYLLESKMSDTLEVSDISKYKVAVTTLRQQLREQPRTHEGGFWHKKIYPYQMWLDGLYMAEPFYAIYAAYFNEPQDFDDIANQFIWMEKHARDSATGLLYHGWDESKKQYWANPVTGCSPSFWGRAMGWYMMGLVDVLDYFPNDHPKRKELVAIFQRTANALLAYRDKQSHLWWQVVNKGGKEKNFLESSASAMFTYAFAKGAKRGFLDKKFFTAAKKSFQGILKHFVTMDMHGIISLHETCESVGLGGTPYRDGSDEYYISVPRRTNDLRGYGPFLLAAIEVER
ncbi:MAG: glycoside hydrolase family 88 protein [Bacteroidota bacterium]|nr:glycoside hydrolase family 88 protein [Bacteroidota bacterium]